MALQRQVGSQVVLPLLELQQLQEQLRLIHMYGIVLLLKQPQLQQD